MNVLVLSDSHAGLSFMRAAIQSLQPNALVHLGDYYEDGETIAFENPNLTMYQVPGNCDMMRCFGKPETLCLTIRGVKILMAHGHQFGVKGSLVKLLAEARRLGAQVVLYGHTHEADCHQEEDGLWVINPGSCGSYSGSVALLELQPQTVVGCRILTADAITW